MGVSSCKCTNIFEPLRLKSRKDKVPNPILNEIHLTKEAKNSPDQSSKYFEKASFNFENNLAFEQKKISSYSCEVQSKHHEKFPQHRVNTRSKERRPIQREKTLSQRSIDGNDTPQVEIHDIKRVENNIEVPVTFDLLILKRFQRDSFMAMFKGIHRNSIKKSEDIAP